MKRCFRPLLCVLLCAALLLPSTLALSPNSDLEVEFHNTELGRYEPCTAAVVNLTLDGTPLLSDLPAVVWQSRTMIPVRLVGERLGATVSWVDETDQVILRNGSTTIVLTLGSATALVNGEAYTLPDQVPATVMRLGSEERTMVPLRFVSEQMGCTVEWEQETYTASIRSPGAASGLVTTIHADANAQTVLISTDQTPNYQTYDYGDRVVLDLLGMRLASGFPGAIKVDNELISSVRYAEHGNDLYESYDHCVRIVLDLKEGISTTNNVAIECMEHGVVISTFLTERDELDYTPSTPLNPSKKTIVLDPGHGGTAAGATYEGILEKDVNLAVAQKLERLLLAQGYNVVMTRSDDSTVGLYDRADIANAVNADIFVSLHSNASETNLQIQGIYTYSHPSSKKGAALAAAIQTPVTQATGAPDRGIQTANFAVLRETKMCAVLVEMGFLSTHEELMKLINDSYQDKLASGIAEGIIRYLNQT